MLSDRASAVRRHRAEPPFRLPPVFPCSNAGLGGGRFSETGSQIFRPVALRAIAHLLMGLTLAGLLLVLFAPTAQAATVNYYVVADSGTAIPGDGTTDVQSGNSYRDGELPRTTFFATGNQNSRVRLEYESDFTGYRTILHAYLPADYGPNDVEIAAGAVFNFGVDDSWDSYRVTLYEYDPGTGTATEMGQAWTGSGSGQTTLSLTLDNPATRIEAGNRLYLQVELDKRSGQRARFHFNDGSWNNEAAWLTVDETEILDGTPPGTSLSTSPSSPDGDDGWFVTAPQITLTADDPEGSATTTYYHWDSDPDQIYAGTFSAMNGQHTLYYHSEDEYGNVEAEQSQLFKVDPDITPPLLTAPTGPESDPTLVGGTIPVEATASDDISGVDRVAFFYFASDGAGGWEPAGTQIGTDQAAPISGDTYGVSWDTLGVLDGEYKLQAQLEDVAGNTAFSAAEYVEVDNTPPAVLLTAPGEGEVIRGVYDVTGSADDANLSSWTLELREVSAGSWTQLASGTANVSGVLHSLDTGAYADGDYELRLSATDDRSLTASATVTFSIDNTPPTVTGAVATWETLVEVAFSEPLDPAGIDAAYFSIDGLNVTGAELLSDGSTVRLTTDPQTPGASYTVTVSDTEPTVTDPAGNPIGIPNSAGFTGYDSATDSVAPAAPASLTVASGHDRNRLSWTGADDPDVAGYNVYRDTSAEGSFTTKVNGALVTETGYDDADYGARGYYYYKVTAVDQNGNESELSAAAGNENVDIDQAVGTAGATLLSSNGKVDLVIPDGALAGDTAITVDELAQPDDIGGFEFVSPAYDLGPDGQSFAANVSITLTYSPGTAVESDIELYYLSGTDWIPVEGGSTVDTAADRVTGLVDHFTQFAAASGDSTPPTVTGVSPADGATDVPVTDPVILTFSEPMDAGTLIEGNLQILDGATPVALDAVVFSTDAQTVYLYPDRMLDISTGYTVYVDGAAVTDLAGNPLGADFTSTFTTSATGVSPHDSYSDSSSLCKNCHTVHGASGPTLFVQASERQVCYICHDGTGSAYNVKTADAVSPYAWDFGEDPIGTTSQTSYHPVPAATGLGTGVTMLCSNCHNAHSMNGVGERFLAVKKLESSLSGTYAAQTGNEFCWTCHDSTAADSAGYITAESWDASTGYDHKSYYPAPGSSHNDLSGRGFLSGDMRVSTKENIACKGCHSEHGTTNGKLIAAKVYGQDVAFDTSSDTAYNTTYNNLCNACHQDQQIGGFSWPGKSTYETSGHGSSSSVMALDYSPPVPAATQNLETRVCKQCHEPHGTGDANGAFPQLTRYFEQGVCFRCHGSGGNPTGAKNMQTVFTRSTRHDLDLSSSAARKHDLNAEYGGSLNPNAGLSAGNRHVECTDCHNTHAADDAVNAGLHSQGSNAVSGVLQGVWGVQPSAGASWSEPSTWDWSAASLYPAESEFQLCFKCHSAAAYGSTPPSRAQNTTTGTSYWPVSTYTDQAKEFNPNNESYHAVWGESKASGRGTYLNGWTSTSKMYCSDCHRSSTSGDPAGPHGSNTPFMLGGYATPGNATWVTGPVSQGSYGNKSTRDSKATFCFGCHDPNFNNTGFTTGGNNLHTNKHEEHACTACHSAVPHGWKRPHLLVLRSDPAPYNDHVGAGYWLPDTIRWPEDEGRTEWRENDCHNSEGVGNCG